MVTGKSPHAMTMLAGLAALRPVQNPQRLMPSTKSFVCH